MSRLAISVRVVKAAAARAAAHQPQPTTTFPDGPTHEHHR